MKTPDAPFELRIGELMLEGMTPGARGLCVGAFSHEFESLVRQRGAPPVAHCVEGDWRLPALTLPAHTGEQPRQVGRALAVALYEALHRAGEGR